jgi:hypothetical protein
MNANDLNANDFSGVVAFKPVELQSGTGGTDFRHAPRPV